MNKPILNQHIEFLKELEGALDEALVSYSDAPASEMEELRHMRREVDFALRSAEKLLDCEGHPGGKPRPLLGRARPDQGLLAGMDAETFSRTP